MAEGRRRGYPYDRPYGENMDKNRHEKENMSKGAARKVIQVESNEENQHEAAGRWASLVWGTKKASGLLA